MAHGKALVVGVKLAPIVQTNTGDLFVTLRNLAPISNRCFPNLARGKLGIYMAAIGGGIVSLDQREWEAKTTRKRNLLSVEEWEKDGKRRKKVGKSSFHYIYCVLPPFQRRKRTMEGII